MIKVAKNINDRLFIINVESYLKEQAESLFQMIGKIESKKLINNFKVQVGFTIFTLQEVNDNFIILSPDYSKNPFKDNTEDLTIALCIQLEQGILLNKLSLAGELVSFQDKIICTKEILKLDNIYLERSGECKKGDSGWYIGPVDDSISNEELEAYYAYQLIKIRPSIIQVLALPSGYMAIFDKDKLKTVLDESDNELIEN